MKGAISTHVLDLVAGKPGKGIPVVLFKSTSSGNGDLSSWSEIASGTTDDDGRVLSMAGSGSALPLETGTYRLVFALEAYFNAAGLDSFLPEAVISFLVKDASEGYHVPLLLSPNGFTTYRGS